MILDINEYEELNDNKVIIKTYLITMIIIILLMIFLMYLFFEKKTIYHENIIIPNDDYLVTVLTKEDFNKLCESKTIMIEDNLYEFYIVEAVFNNEGDNSYYETVINIPKFRILKNTEFKIKMKEESILNYLKEIIGGKNYE